MLRYNITRYCTQHNFEDKTLVKLRTPARHPYFALTGELWVSLFEGKLTRDIGIYTYILCELYGNGYYLYMYISQHNYVSQHTNIIFHGQDECLLWENMRWLSQACMILVCTRLDSDLWLCMKIYFCEIPVVKTVQIILDLHFKKQLSIF